MSWDLYLFRIEEKHGDEIKFDDEAYEHSLPFESAEEVRAAIARAIGSVDWSDESIGTWQQDGLSMDVIIGSEDPVESILVSVHGEGDPYEYLESLAEHLKCHLYDCALDEVLDWENLNRDGWDGGVRVYYDVAMHGYTQDQSKTKYIA